MNEAVTFKAAVSLRAPCISALKTSAMIAVVALAYAGSGRLGLMLAIPPGYSTAIFPAAGVALTAVLLSGWKVLPGVWLGSFLMNSWIGIESSHMFQPASLLIPALIASGALLQALAGARLMQRWVGYQCALDDERDIFKFILLCGAVASLIGATVGITTLWYFGAVTGDKFVSNWANWWLGDALGVLIVVPVLLAFLGHPRELWRNRRFALTMPLAITVSLVVTGYVASSRWEQQRIEVEFGYRAVKLGDELESMLSKQLESLSWVVRYFKTSQHVDRDEFSRFVAPIVASNTSIKSLEWAPLIPGGQRDALEEQMRQEGYREFEIAELYAQKQKAHAASQSEYFPILFIEPWIENKAQLGYDLASDPFQHAAMEQARRINGPSATGRMQLASSTDAGTGVRVFFPVEVPTAPETSGSDRVATLLGFVSGVIWLDKLAGMALLPPDRDLFMLELTDLSARDGVQTLYASSATATANTNAAFTYTHEFDFAGRQWQARYAATPAYLQQQAGWQSWSILAAGLLFTGLLETFLLSVTGRTSRVERLIKERTHELRQAHHIVNEAQRIAHLGHWTWNLQTNQETWSGEQARIFGFEPSRLTIDHELFVAAIHTDDREKVVNAIHAALNGKDSYHTECRICLRSGAIRHVVYEGEVERDAAGIALRMVGIVLDVTESRRAEVEIITAKEEALRANHAKSEFLSSMLHELRTPLNAVLGFAQLMSYDPELPPRHQGTVMKIRTAGEHLLDLIKNMLDLSHIEIGHMNLSMETVELDSFLNECSSLVQPLVDQCGLRFIAQRRCTGIHVVADRLRLKQALVNLLTNAVKYNREHGEIELLCEACDGTVRIGVRDTGKGMSAEQQAQLFQPFNRLGQERGVIEGTGIGLVITKRLVELMNGELSVFSAVDQGSTFSIELLQVPAPQPAGQNLQTIASQPPMVALDSTFALLYVEDNPASMELMRVLAESIWPKACFLGVSTAEAGLDIAFSQHLDVILLDINLPGMDGYAALEQLKAHPRTKHIPVLALTANAMANDVRRGDQAGFAAYLTKPLNIVLLIDTMNTLLAQRTVKPVQRVLIAEDNSVNQEILRAMVQVLGYESDVVGDGVAALAAVQKKPYAVVLMDCEMPHMDGYATTRAIRRLSGLAARIPVVAVSAHAADEDAERRMDAGIIDVLPKPVDIEQLKSILARYAPLA